MTCDISVRDQAGSRSLVFDLSITHDRYGSSSHPLQNGLLTHPQDIDAPLHIAAQRKMNSYRGDRGTLHCHLRAIATQPIGLVPFQARGILPVAEEQRRTRGGQSGGDTDQPRCRGLWHSSRPSARSLSRSDTLPFFSPSLFHTISFPPRSLVRDGQTSPHRARLVVSRSACVS